MDLKSMLNDSAGQRGPQAPRITTSAGTHTPHSSYDARIEHTPSSDVSSARPTPYAPPLQTGDPRDPRAQSSGSYFAIHSPHPNTSASASTPSVGPPSAYAQSPGSHAGIYTPRDHPPPSNVAHPNPAFVSPTPSIHHPPTPNSAHQPYPPQQHGYAQNHITAQYQQFQSPPPPQPNGLPPSQVRQISPVHQYQSQPATPLGPPMPYARPSPQAQRPPSQGGPSDYHLRRASQTSIGSVMSNHYPPHPPEQHQRRESIQRNHSYSYDSRSREQSMSVSPKTIPRPTPQREHSASSHTLSHGRPSLPHQSHSDQRLSISQQPNNNGQVEPVQLPVSVRAPAPIPSPPTVQHSAPSHVTSSDPDSHLSFNDQSLQSSPAITRTEQLPPGHIVPMKQEEPEPVQTPEKSLKRSASHFSDTVSQPRPKRTRHDIPVWAQNARKDRPLRFIEPPTQNHHRSRQQPVSKPIPSPNPGLNRAPQEYTFPPASNGDLHVNGSSTGHHVPGPPVKAWKWEETISNTIPSESMVKLICDWIWSEIGNTPPPPGCQWEVEAKVGKIIDSNTDRRMGFAFIHQELVLNSSDPGLPKYRFKSEMDINQHKAIDTYLVQCYRDNMEALSRGEVRDKERTIEAKRIRDLDELYDLSDEGKSQLDPTLQTWLNRSLNQKSQIRVRRTIDNTAPSAEGTSNHTHLIKARISDREIHNPIDDFDYRISISLEAEWHGDKSHLRPAKDPRTHQDLTGRDKNRMSYRHREFQIDLTQVRHYSDPKQVEHELEVEIAPWTLAATLEAVRNQQPNKFEEMVRLMISNVRLLTKNATVRGH